MRTLVTALCLFTATAFVATELPTGQVEARKRSKKKRRKRKVKRKKALKATKQTFTGLNKLMGKYKWGMSNAKVLRMIRDQIRAEEEPILKKIKDPLEQDKRRREMFAKLKKVKKNYVTFGGKRTPWDVSLVDKEFAHRNNESMAVVWKKKERRFFFFHHGQLWKLFIAFNAEMFEDKTFEDFAKVMEARFGPAERKFTVTLKGDQKMDHLAWPQAGRTKLLAYDLTAFYGNFCLSLVDMQTWANVKHGRELNSPKRKYSDPLVKAVTTPGGEGRDENEDIVDQITGKGTRAPAVGGSSGGTSPSSPSPSRPGYSPARPKKKLDPKNPLKGLDI
jgi:hypothetical protein